ncbi:hypothetical protein KAT73_03695 [candidate division WOR-3 bacterium]|nr:hypothetical protein [candidate division WOR-3 bacterium]
MKNLSILFNIFGFLLLFASCSRDYPLHEKDTQFPLSVGNWWQYEEVWIIEDVKPIKDDINHNGTVHWKIIDRDAVGRERYDTYVLECNDYSEWSEPYYSFNWYSESWEGESGLFHIAHWGVGTSCPKLFLPYKIKFMKREFNSPDEVFDYIRGFIYTKEDTSLRVPPRKVLVYPLWFGKEWVVFDDAWLQERRVVDMETISQRLLVISLVTR